MSCKDHPMPEEGCETCRADMWMGAAQTSAAHNARLCEIALKADELAEQVGRLLGSGTYSMSKLQKALDAYKIVRSGH